MDVVDLTVSDDVQGFVCDIASLAAGASTTCSLNGIASFGLYENLGSAAGTYTDGSGNEAPLNADDPKLLPGCTASHQHRETDQRCGRFGDPRRFDC